MLDNLLTEAKEISNNRDMVMDTIFWQRYLKKTGTKRTLIATIRNSQLKLLRYIGKRVRRI